jgi:segregation and condensation protein B
MDHAQPSPEDSPPSVVRLVEAMLFVGGAPLSAARACEVLQGVTPEAFTQAIATLNRDYRDQGRPYRIQPRDQGYELALRPSFAVVRDRLFGATREARLSQAALDTLALVAYRQPVTRQEIDTQRGADSLAQLRQLVRLGLIAVQRGDAAQTEACYGTTARFLRLFGLRGLDDLPRVQEMQKG